MALKQRGIKAENLSSGMASGALGNAENGGYAILYMTPEKACLLPDRYIKISYFLPNTINSLTCPSSYSPIFTLIAGLFSMSHLIFVDFMHANRLVLRFSSN